MSNRIIVRAIIIYGIGPEDPKRFSNVLQVLQRDNYDCAKILGAFADVDDVTKLRLEVDNAWRTLRPRNSEEVKDTLHLRNSSCNMGLVLTKSWHLC